MLCLSRLSFIVWPGRWSRAFTRYSALVALTLLASWPLLTGGLPTVGDGLNHFQRFAQLDWHIRHGDFYPRWFVNLHYGFGAPVFNFYAPLSYYVPLLFRLLNLPLSTCLLLGYVLAFGVAIFGTHDWVRDQFDSELAGLTASAAFALAPYLYLNLLHRGAYPELWGLALAPWLFRSAHRLALLPDRRSLLWLAVIHAALILVHTLSALLFTPLAVIYGFALSLSTTRKPYQHSPLRTLGLWLLAFGISIALTAFFTLPVFFESKDIQLFRTFLPGDLDYRNNFLTVSGLLAQPANFDPDLVFNTMPASLAWPQMGLALIALALAWIKPNRDRQQAMSVTLFSAFCLLFSFLTLSASAPLWNGLPFARFIQFPWRLVGPVSLCLAALAGSTIAQRSRFALQASLIAIVSFFFFSLSWTYHSTFASPPASVSPADAIAFEIATGQLGATSAGEYLPRWVEQLPDPQAINFSDTEIPSRLAPLPSNVALHASRSTLYTEEFDYTSPNPFTIIFNRFYFPGWAAIVDGSAVAVGPASPNGLIAISAPAGQHTLRLELRSTPPQLIGTLITVIAVGVLTFLAFRVSRTATSKIGDAQYAGREAAMVSLAMVLLLMARALYLDRVETPFHYTRLNSLPNPISVNFDNQLELIGFEHPPALISGGQLPVTIYWRALARLTADYSTTVQLADRFGNRFGVSDSQHPGRVPTSRWTLDQYALDTHLLVPLGGTPPGDYHLVVGAYAAQPLSLIQEGAPIGIEYDLGTVTVERAEPQPPGPFGLVESKLATDAVMVGDQLPFTLLWNSGQKPLPGLTARLLLTDVNGQKIFGADLPPAGEDYPTSQWAPNELIRYPFSVGLPADLPGGRARISLLLLDANEVVWAGPFAIGSVTITVPERSFVIPAMAHRVNHDFGEAIRLLGYDLNSDSITLYWQSLKSVAPRFTVFVHKLDESGAFLAGHDSAPLRATASWLPGEVITDVHPISVGGHFEVGLYDQRTSERYGEIFVENLVTSP